VNRLTHVDAVMEQLVNMARVWWGGDRGPRLAWTFLVASSAPVSLRSRG